MIGHWLIRARSNRLIAFAAIIAACASACASTGAEDLDYARQQISKRGSNEIKYLITQVDADLTVDPRFLPEEPMQSTEQAFQEETIGLNSNPNNASDNGSSNGHQGAANSQAQVEAGGNTVDAGKASSDPLVADIPIEINARVEKWIRYFTKDNPARFQRFLNRGEKYRERILEILGDHEVPAELYYLAMIESGFVIRAKSRANAVGFWQFISATGKRYGLDRNYYVDERHDPFRGTMAAASYLKDLHRVFDSWYLAMASYNAGEMRILRSIMRANSRDFWELVRKKALPRETMDYVPKFLAAAIIGRNPEKFGFTISKEDKIGEVALVDVPTPIRLSTVAKKLSLNHAELKRLNPHLRRGITPPTGKSYGIWVPLASEASVRKGFKLLAAHKVKKARRVRQVASSKIRYHRVRRGENLTLIARKYGLPVWKLRRLNGLKSSRIHAGQRLKVRGGSKARIKRYRVRRGDNLFKIAQKFGVSIRQIKKTNRIRSNVIRVGQMLRIAKNSG